MLRTLLAGTTLATLLAFAAHAQETPGADTPAEVSPPREIGNQEPALTNEEPTLPQSADDSGAAPADATSPVPATPDATASDTMAPDTMAPDASADATAEPPAATGALPEGWAPVDLATVTPDMLIGADIRSPDGETIASVEDVLMSVEGKVDNLVARFGGFLGFGETNVLLTPTEIAVATDANGNVAVLTSLTQEELKGRPEYVAPEGADAPG
jgi:hypothetical protein